MAKVMGVLAIAGFAALAAIADSIATGSMSIAAGICWAVPAAAVMAGAGYVYSRLEEVE